LACHLKIDADPDLDPVYHFDADADPDPAYHFDADADPDPTFQSDADPCGSGSTTLVCAPLGYSLGAKEVLEGRLYSIHSRTNFGTGEQRKQGGCFIMKQIHEVEKKPVTSSVL
jgi:hypothetical protein